MSIGKTDSGGATAAFYTAAQDGKTMRQITHNKLRRLIIWIVLDEDTQITATLTTVGTTSTAGQATVTITYIQANNLRDVAPNT